MSSPDARARITFAIPYYDGLAYLREAIESVLAQTIEDWELVVVDDRGPHAAESLVASFSDPRIRYRLNTENLGLAGNWNECLRQAGAPLVTILHGDDRLLPDYAARVIRAMEQRPDVTAVFTDANIIDPGGAPTSTLADVVKSWLPRPAGSTVLQGDRDLASLLRGNYIVCPTLCFRRALLDDAPFDATLRFVPDWDFTTRVLLGGGSLFGIREPLLEYRRHPESQTSALTSDASRFGEEIELMRDRSRDAADLGWKRSERTARIRLTVRVHIAVRALIDLARGHGVAFRSKMRILGRDLLGQ